MADEVQTDADEAETKNNEVETESDEKETEDEDAQEDDDPQEDDGAQEDGEVDEDEGRQIFLILCTLWLCSYENSIWIERAWSMRTNSFQIMDNSFHQ